MYMRGKQRNNNKGEEFGERGITGLETAIVLIAFVVVASVFSFSVLSSGLQSSDQSKQAIHEGLSEARGTLEIRGSVIAEDSDSNGEIDKVYFQLANAAGGEPVDLTQGMTVIRYNDATQSVYFDAAGDFSVVPVGDADSDNLLEPGEMIEVTLLDLENKLAANLVSGSIFTVEVIPSQGALLFIERSIPALVAEFNDLT
jgi:flagellin FlaB